MKTQLTKLILKKTTAPRASGRAGWTRRIVSACALCLCLAPAPTFADILIHLDATGLTPGVPLATWTNTGTTIGDFLTDGGATPLVTNVAGVNAVAFITTGGADGAGSTHYVGPIAPPAVTGTNSRTVEAWVYNPSPQAEEVVFAWGRRNGAPDGSNWSFNHGTDPAFGAGGFWGPPDIGWNSQITFNAWTHIVATWDNATRVTRVYRDGVQVNVESNILMNTHSLGTGGQQLRFRVARQSGGTGTPSGTGVGEIIIAKVRAHDLALSPAAVAANYQAERCLFTNDTILCADSDSDGIPDGYELRFPTCLNTNDANDATIDCDSDGLTNLQEFQNGTYPNVADTDGDGINDGTEVNRLDGGNPAPTNPLAVDTDNDGLSDAVETDTGTFVSATDTGTDPRVKDTDGDGLADRFEVTFSACMNPNVADAGNDCDSDGLTNLQEFQLGTGPTNSDTDADGAADGAEVNRTDGGNPAPTNPLAADTDGDGIRDGAETDTGVFVSLSNTGTDPLIRDTDGDRFNDLHEIVRSTDPTQVLSFPDLANPALTPLISLDATTLAPGPLSTWTNNGVLAGVFNAAAGTPPSIETIQNIRGVTLNGVTGGNNYYTGQDPFNQVGGSGAPSFLVGTNARTIEAWVYNPAAAPEETTFAWGRRGGGPDGSNLSFNHGTDPAFGAVGHWGGGPDISWGNAPTGGVAVGRWTYVAYTYQPTNNRVIVYKDGVMANTEVNSLPTHEFSTAGTRLPFRVGSQNEANGTPTPNLRGSMTIALIRVYETAFDGVTISNKFAAEADAFGVIDTDADGLPTWYERLYPGCLDPNDPTDAAEDCDSDTATNLEEYTAGSSPIIADTDGDGLPDGAELHRLDGGNPAPTNPLRSDTDQDGLADGVETDTGIYVSPSDTGSDPRVVDSDADGFADGQEVAHNSDPNNAIITPDFDFEDPLAIINLDATGLATGALNVWTNLGALGGVFTANAPAATVTTVDSVAGLTVDGTNFYTGPVAPIYLTRSNSHTVVAWIYNPDVALEETIFAWGRRGTDGLNMSFNHGTSPAFGAVTHFGAPDIGWNGNISTGRWTFVAYTYHLPTLTQTVYRDGQVATNETNIVLNIASVDTTGNPLPFRVASQNESGGTPTVGLRGAMTIGRIRVYDEALTAADILAQYNAEVITFNPPQVTIRVSHVEICTTTLSGFNYQVEYRSSLAPEAWVPIACIVGDGTRKCVFDAVPVGGPQRFYRVVVANCTP